MTQTLSLAREALQLAEHGDDAGASELFERGLTQFPGDARFANSAGSFHAKAGRDERAVELYRRALEIDPSLEEAAINGAIVLVRLGRAHEACVLLAGREASANPRYWVVRGDAERVSGDLAAAAESFERGARLEPGHPRSLAGRARVALERCETGAVTAYEVALARNPGDPNLIRDYIQALATAGRLDMALEASTLLIRQLPVWAEGLALHAELRWASGDRAQFDDHFVAATAGSNDPALHLAWANTLFGVDRFEQAAKVLEAAQSRWPAESRLAIARGVALGEAGLAVEAEAVLDHSSHGRSADWALARSRIAIQRGDNALAETLLGEVLAARPGDIAAWALIDLCWRRTGNERHQWLHGDPALVRLLELPLDASEFVAIRERLDAIHQATAMPIGQSVKLGSQTKGALICRMEPEFARLAEALTGVIELYRAGLPAFDDKHPLLAQRDAPWRITGSWSIRLDGEGHHAPHIHPLGLLSSACYFTVPEECAGIDRAGWLEIGRPPKVLAPDLDSLTMIEPRPGFCTLFPSTLFHGTRPITQGCRMTVAFDVQADTRNAA